MARWETECYPRHPPTAHPWQPLSYIFGHVEPVYKRLQQWGWQRRKVVNLAALLPTLSYKTLTFAVLE